MQIERGIIECTLTAAVENEQRIVRGTASSYSIMHSGRCIAPTALDKWVAAHSAADVALLAKHGQVWGFATIGQLTGLKVARTGVQFTARLAQDIQLAEDAWKLASQGMPLRVSQGWYGEPVRLSVGDERLTPEQRKQAKARGLEQVVWFSEIELVEISLVDLGDDPQARLAAELRDVDSRLRGNDAGAGGLTRDELVAALRAELGAAISSAEQRIIESIEARLADAGDAYALDAAQRADDAERVPAGQTAAPRVNWSGLMATLGARQPRS